jgi:hypothetical protein
VNLKKFTISIKAKEFHQNNLIKNGSRKIVILKRQLFIDFISKNKHKDVISPKIFYNDNFSSGGQSKDFRLCLLTFLGYFTIGLSLATLPIFIHQTLGFNTIIAGLVISVQYVRYILTPRLCRKIVDTKGPKISVLRSMLFFALSGLLLLLVFLFKSQPFISLGFCLLPACLLELERV